MRLNYKAREGETIQYVDVMSLYLYIYKYLKFPVGQIVIHVGDAYKDKEACLRMDGLITCSIVPPEVVSSRVPLPSQSETHVLSVPNLIPNLQYRRMLSYDIRGGGTDWYVGH